MRRFLPLALAAVCLAAAAGVAAPARAAVPNLERIAIVDVQRCLLETAEGQKAKKNLEKTFNKGQRKLDKKAQDLEKRVRDLQAKAAMLSEAELGKRQQELIRSQGELQQLSMELQEEVANKEALLTERIYKKVSAIVKELATEDDLQIVLVRSELTVIYSNPKLDLTNRVIVRYDSKYPSK
jgi:outer membrane protein